MKARTLRPITANYLYGEDLDPDPLAIPEGSVIETLREEDDLSLTCYFADSCLLPGMSYGSILKEDLVILEDEDEN